MNGHQAALRVQAVISALAPPLHSLHWKILLLCLAAVFVPGLYFAWKVGQGIERSHLRSTEQGMIDTALVVAGRPGQSADASLAMAHTINRKVFGDAGLNLRVLWLDSGGRVLADSSRMEMPGTDRSNLRDVRKAMEGGYGARWERDSSRQTVVLHSTVPVFAADGTQDGLVSVSKTTRDVRRSVIRSLLDLAIPAAIAFLLAVLVATALSTYLTRLLAGLAKQARRVADGEPGVGLETWSKSELGDLARALEQMRLKLEGRREVEDMALALSHEIKTPVAAIRGAAELLQQDPAPGVRERFLGNILEETRRLTAIATNFLTLSRIGTGGLERGVRASLGAVACEVAAAFRSRAGDRNFEADIEPGDIWLPLRADALRRLIDAIVENAFQFTPPGGTVRMETRGRHLRVLDEGPGIPAALVGKIFDRFFTTTNPVTGRRGTGLGLAIAKAVADRCGARIDVRSRPEKGTEFVVVFTRIS